jgi:HEAT repeat protein
MCPVLLSARSIGNVPRPRVAAMCAAMALVALAWLSGCGANSERQAIRRLQSGSPDERIGAAQLLVQLRNERVEAPLLSALADASPENGSVRRIVAEGLAKWGKPDLVGAAVEAMTKDLASDDPEIQHGAVQVLVGVQTPAATAALVSALRSADPRARETAAKALTARNVSLSPDDHIRLALIQGRHEAVADVGQDAVPLLVELLDDDPIMRSAAATALGLIGERASVRRALQVMLDDLQAADTATRAGAVNALGALGDPSAVAPLGNLAQNDADSTVRASARVAAYVVQKDLTSLISTLRAPSPLLQTIAIRGLRHLPQRERNAAVQPLIRLLRTTTDRRVAAEAAATLAACGRVAAGPILDALDQEPEWVPRKSLAQALASERVLQAMDQEMQVRLYNLWERETNDSVKGDLAQVLAKLEPR